MIRATMGISMDGWSRPNHMPSHLDAIQSMISVNFRRFPGDLHSVAKQALLKTLFFRVPARSWSDFRRFWDAKMEVKINFGEFFFWCFFDCVLASLSNGFLDGRTSKNL